LSDYIVKRTFSSVFITGIFATGLCFIIACVYWPVWGTIAKTFATYLAGPGLALSETKIVSKYYTVFAEATFFWTIINAWIWQTLIFGNYGKTFITDRQPWAGIWYTFVGFAMGIIGFLILVGFLGIWWKPFNLGILFTPQSAEEVIMAIEGFEVSNFYALVVITAQIPFVSLLHKWPFAGNIKAPWDGFGVMMFSTVAALLVWIANIMPSLLNITIGGHIATVSPLGSWPTYLAFSECFIFWFLIPAEGGEHYPMKLFYQKQPYMGLIGLIIALVGGYGTMIILRQILGSMNILPGVPIDLVVASFALSLVLTQLLWHHLFDDYPTNQMISNQIVRVLIRIAIWIVLGSIVGILWLKYFKLLPFAGNDMGFGFPVMGLLAGQFAFMMVYLYMNTFFDKWPLVRKVK